MRWPSTADCYHYYLRALWLGSDLFQNWIDSLGVADVCLTSAIALQRFTTLLTLVHQEISSNIIYAMIWYDFYIVSIWFVYCLCTFHSWILQCFNGQGWRVASLPAQRVLELERYRSLTNPILMFCFFSFPVFFSPTFQWIWLNFTTSKFGIIFTNCLCFFFLRGLFQKKFRCSFCPSLHGSPRSRDPKWSRQPDSHMGWCLSWWIERVYMIFWG